MMLGRPSPSYTARGYSAPRPGVIAGRPRSLLARAFARNSPLRHMDWILIVVVLGLSAIGTLLVWSATQPGLLAAGQDPRTYLKKQLLNVVIGLVLMIAVSVFDIAPTILHLYGIRKPSYMKGHVLSEIFEKPAAPASH